VPRSNRDRRVRQDVAADEELVRARRGEEGIEECEQAVVKAALPGKARARASAHRRAA
jgi:hypothetical protein